MCEYVQALGSVWEYVQAGVGVQCTHNVFCTYRHSVWVGLGVCKAVSNVWEYVEAVGGGLLIGWCISLYSVHRCRPYLPGVN